MASKQEIEKELKIALKEIGPIIPWFDKAVNEWIFSSPLYPSVEYGGETKEEVLKKTIEIAKNQGDSSVVIHKQDGKIQEERTYPKSTDPYPPEG